MQELQAFRLAHLRVRSELALINLELKERRRARISPAQARPFAHASRRAPTLRPPDSVEDIRWNLAQLRNQLAWARFELLQRKAGFNPEQPRIPAGNGRVSGRWVDPAGIGHNQGPPLEEPPKIPKQRPSTAKQRNAFVKAAARWLLRFAGRVSVLIQVGLWIYDDIAAIEAYRDPPKSLAELQEAAQHPRAGYDRHHVVEQTHAEQDGFSKGLIDAPDNVVLIPRLKHWEINGWLQTPNGKYGDMTPREYLRDKDWETRTRFGLDVLKDFGVLKR
jgi:hypothetical protein